MTGKYSGRRRISRGHLGTRAGPGVRSVNWRWRNSQDTMFRKILRSSEKLGSTLHKSLSRITLRGITLEMLSHREALLWGTEESNGLPEGSPHHQLPLLPHCLPRGHSASEHPNSGEEAGRLRPALAGTLPTTVVPKPRQDLALFASGGGAIPEGAEPDGGVPGPC